MKLRIGIAMVAAIAAIAAPAVYAQDQPSGLSVQYLACGARAGSNTVQGGICAQTEMAAQDARLNKAYQQVMRQLANRPQQRLALRDAQRSWLRRRDYECKIDQITIDNTCLVTKTATRANELESRIHF